MLDSMSASRVRRRVSLAMPVQVDRQHHDDEHEQHDPRRGRDVEVDEVVGTVGTGGSEDHGSWAFRLSLNEQSKVSLPTRISGRAGGRALLPY